MHADGKSTLASVSKWNSGKANCLGLSGFTAAFAFKMADFLAESAGLITSFANIQMSFLKF